MKYCNHAMRNLVSISEGKSTFTVGCKRCRVKKRYIYTKTGNTKLLSTREWVPEDLTGKQRMVSLPESSVALLLELAPTGIGHLTPTARIELAEVIAEIKQKLKRTQT